MNATHQCQLLSAIVDRIDVGILVVDADINIVLWNNFMSTYGGIVADQALGQSLFDCFADIPRSWLEKKIESVFKLRSYAFTSWEYQPYLIRMPHDRPITGGVDAMRQNCTFMPIGGSDNFVEYVCITIVDYTETALTNIRLQRAVASLAEEKKEQQALLMQLRESQALLLQSEKMASIGQLAAGVAHEINNPIGFVSSNLHSLESYVNNLLRLVEVYERVGDAVDRQSDRLESLALVRKEIDFDFIREDAPSLMAESKEGLERVKRIVNDLKNFSRVDPSAWEATDLHHCIETTLNIVNNELKYKVELVKEYGELPDVECMPSQINQVIMNLLVNAAQSIEHRGWVTIRTSCCDDWVRLAVEDSGSGIEPENLARLFDPFFTTKPVGSGTGLGLSVSHGIVSRHRGRIEVDSVLGKGSTFTVWLPIHQSVQSMKN